MQFYNWEYVRCGTDLKNRKYFSNTNIEYDLKTKKDSFFDFDTIDSDSTSSSLKFFKIYKSENFLDNFGFVFIKEIKLWQQYNINYLDTKHIYFDMTKITKEEIKKTFPGLLLYYQNDFNLTKEGLSVIKEQMTGDIKYIYRTSKYIGYNILEPYIGKYTHVLMVKFMMKLMAVYVPKDLIKTVMNVFLTVMKWMPYVKNIVTLINNV